jgi:hypothetical protein
MPRLSKMPTILFLCMYVFIFLRDKYCVLTYVVFILIVYFVILMFIQSITITIFT